MQLVAGNWPMQAVYAAANLELADHIDDGPQTAEQAIPRSSALDAPSLYRLLRPWRAWAYFAEDAAGRFSLTPMADKLLRKDAEGSLWAAAIMMGTEHYTAWGRLVDSVRQGEVVVQAAIRRGRVRLLREASRRPRNLHRAMTELTSQTHVAAVEAYDFSRFAKADRRRRRPRHADLGHSQGQPATARRSLRSAQRHGPDAAATSPNKASPTAARQSAATSSPPCPRAPTPTSSRP